ncbi:MAG: site-2 protease family protein [Nitrosomonadales bacterium]
MELNKVQYLAISIIPILFAITVHEAAHGYAAKYFGDKTAHYLKRISLNPLRHIDPVGTIVIPVIMFLTSPFIFGWAKPVPVNFNNLKNPKKDMFWVALAGPASNFLMAILWTIVYKLIFLFPTSASMFIRGMCEIGIFINLLLMVLNLLPIPPLDGGRIAISLLPQPYSYKLASIERYGMFILIFLLLTGFLSFLIMPLIQFFRHIIFTIF